MKKNLLLIMVFGIWIFSLGMGHCAEPIKIGGIFSLTGPGAYIGVAQKNSVMIAIDDFNKKETLSIGERLRIRGLREKRDKILREFDIFGRT